MKKYIASADLVRTVAIVGAISIHIVQPIYSRYDFLGGFTWWITDIWNAFSRISIPLFIMLSGYLLLGRPHTQRDVLQRTLHRLVLPLLFWFVFYTLWNGGYPSFKNFKLIPMLTSLLTSSVFHLYFLVILIGLYLLIPTLQKHFLKWYFAVFFLIMGIGFTVAQYHFHGVLFTSAFTIWIPYLGYFLAGHFLGTLRLSKKRALITLGLLLMGLITTIVLSWESLKWLHVGNAFLYPPGVLSPYFDNYLSPNVMLASLSAFILLLALRPQRKALIFVKVIARNAFGLYLIHPFVIDTIDKPLHLSNDFVHIPLLPYLVGKFLIVFLVSMALVSLGRRLHLTRAVL